MSTVTYKGTYSEHTVELGKRYNVTREGPAADMCIERTIADDFPLAVGLLIRTNGDLDVWYVDLSRSANVYWHFAAGSGERIHPITEAQRKTMFRLRDNIDIYGNLGGNLGADVIKWAFGGEAERIAKAYHD